MAKRGDAAFLGTGGQHQRVITSMRDRPPQMRRGSARSAADQKRPSSLRLQSCERQDNLSIKIRRHECGRAKVKRSVSSLALIYAVHCMLKMRCQCRNIYS